MNEEKEVSIDKQIRQNYRQHFLNKTSIVSFLALFVALALLLAYFVPFSLFLTIPFILLPLLVGFVLEIMLSMNGKGTPSGIFQGFRVYFSTNFFGTFRILEGILKTILVYLISTSIFTLIFHFSIGVNDPSYIALLNNLLDRQNIEVLEKNIQELLANPTYVFIANLTEIIAFGLASYMMIHHILTHSFKLFYNLASKKPLPAVVVNVLHRRSFPRFRKVFYGDYYGTFWYMIIVFVLCYAGGATFGLLVLHQSGIHSAVIGLFLASMISIFFLPIVFDTLSIMFSIYIVFYVQTFFTYENEFKNMYGISLPFSEEDKKQVDQRLKEIEQAIKDPKGFVESKKKKDDDNN